MSGIQSIATPALIRHAVAFCALLWAFRFTRRWPYLFILVSLPANLAHELAHLAAGIFFAARPVSLSMIPRRQPDGGWILGQVRFARLRWWNSIFVGAAPLALVPIGAVVFWWSIQISLLTWPGAATMLIAVQCVMSAWPSRSDWIQVLDGVVSWSLLAMMLLFLGHWMGLVR